MQNHLKQQNKPDTPLQPSVQEDSAAEQRFSVSVNGEMQELTLDALLEAASRGLSKQDTVNLAETAPNVKLYASFAAAYPNVKPGEIPQEVWDWAEQEGSLISAYRKWEILQLQDELAALRTNRKNLDAAIGTAQTDGEPVGLDPVMLALLGK